MKVEAEFLTRPKDGETANGDAGFIRIGDVTWLVVIDGLGHGEKAAEASHAAVACLEARPATRGLEDMVEDVHAALQGTRGAGAMFCRIEEGVLNGCSVGNVELRCSGVSVPVFLTPGVLGRHIRTFRPFSAELTPGARLVMYSDGLSRRAVPEDVCGMTRSKACQALMTKHRNSADDATVLLADIVP